MAGWDPQLLLGGGTPTLTQAPASGSGKIGSLVSGNVQPHHGLVGLVLISVLILFVLDRIGYRFFVTAGKR